MKTLFVCFLVKIAEILCHTQDYPNSETLRPETVYNFTDKNIMPGVIAKYIISRKNNTLLAENPTASVVWNNLFNNNMKNNTNAKEMSSTDNIKKIKMIKSMPYKYIEVIHYVPVKVTTSGGAKKIILDANSSLDNMQQVIVNNDKVREMQKVILDGSNNIQNNDDFNQVKNSIFNEENLHKINNLNNMEEVFDDNRRNLKKYMIFNDGQTNTGTIIEKDGLNIDKEALLNSLGYFVRHPPKGDYLKSKIIFIQILHNFVKYLEARGISGLEILEYLQRQREVANKGFEVLFTNGKQNSGDYTKVIHLNDNNNLRNEEIMSAIEKQALLSSDNYYYLPKEEDLFTFKNKEIYILILRDFVKYLIQKGITDSQIMEYLQRVQKEETKDEAKEITQKSLNKNDELALKTNEEVGKDIALNENVYTENPKNYEILSNDSTSFIENLLNTSHKHELKTNLSSIQMPKTFETTGISKSEDSDEDTENINSYKILEEDKKISEIKNIIENLHEKIPLDTTTELKTLHNNLTSEEVQTTVTNVPIVNNRRTNLNIKSDFSIKTEKEEITKDKEDVNTEVYKDIVEENKSNTSKPLKLLSELNILNDKLNINNEKVKYENVSLEKSIIPNEDIENYETIKVQNSTESALNVPTEKVNILDTDHKDRSNKNKDIYIQKDNIDFIDLWTSEKPNLTSIFDFESPKLTNIHTNSNNKKIEDKDIPTIKDNIDFIDLWTSEKPNLTSVFNVESSKLTNIHTNKDNKENEDAYIPINKENIDFIDLWTSEKPNLTSVLDVELSKLTNIYTNAVNKENKDAYIPINKDTIDFIDLWTSEKPNLTSVFDVESSKLTNIHTNTENKENEDGYIPMNKDNIDFIDLWTSEKPNLTSVFDVESSKLTNIHTNADNKESKDAYIPINKDNIDFIDLWTSEKPNLTSVFDVESSKLNSVDTNSHNTDSLSKGEEINIFKDNKDLLWTSEKPNLKTIFNIKPPILKNLHINNDKDRKIKHHNYNTDYINKIEPATEIISEIIKLRKLLSKLIIVLKLILKELHPNNNQFHNNIVRKLLQNKLINSHEMNIKTKLETNDIFLIEKLKLLYMILTLLTNSKCNNDLDVQKIISKYVHSNDFNDISFTNDDLNEKLLLLVNLLQIKGIPQEQMMKIIRVSLINTINPITKRTYQNNFVNNLLYNLQLSLYKSLLSMVV